MKNFKNIALLVSVSALISSCTKTEVINSNNIQASSFSVGKSTRISAYKSVMTSNNKIQLLVDGDEIFPEIFNTIDSAKKSVYVATYLFGESIGHKIAEKLIAKKKEGVQVEFVAEKTMGSLPELTAAASKEYKFMAANGVEVRGFPVDLMPKGPTFLSNQKVINHSKMVVADGQTVIVGGMNFKDSESINHDYMLKIQGDAAYELGKIGDDDWSKSRTLSIKSLLETPARNDLGATDVEITQTGFQEQTIAPMLLNHINNAQKSIRIEMLLIDHQDIVKALSAAKKRGVDVKMIIDEVDIGKYNKILEKLPIEGMANFAAVMDLLDAGIDVKWYIPQKKDQMLHSKTMLIDDKIFITGSANYTYHALTRNHELAVAVNDVNVAGKYSKQFDQDWISKTKVAKLSTTQRIIGKIFKKFDDAVYKMTEAELTGEIRKQLK